MNVASIINWLGDFSTIKIPGKYASRVGQCFSSFLKTFDASGVNLEEIPDVENDKWNFTDGAGMMSTDIA